MSRRLHLRVADGNCCGSHCSLFIRGFESVGHAGDFTRNPGTKLHRNANHFCSPLRIEFSRENIKVCRIENSFVAQLFFKFDEDSFGSMWNLYNFCFRILIEKFHTCDLACFKRFSNSSYHVPYGFASVPALRFFEISNVFDVLAAKTDVNASRQALLLRIHYYFRTLRLHFLAHGSLPPSRSCQLV